MTILLSYIAISILWLIIHVLIAKYTSIRYDEDRVALVIFGMIGWPLGIAAVLIILPIEGAKYIFKKVQKDKTTL